MCGGQLTILVVTSFLLPCGNHWWNSASQAYMQACLPAAPFTSPNFLLWSYGFVILMYRPQHIFFNVGAVSNTCLPSSSSGDDSHILPFEYTSACSSFLHPVHQKGRSLVLLHLRLSQHHLSVGKHLTLFTVPSSGGSSSKHLLSALTFPCGFQCCLSSSSEWLMSESVADRYAASV